MFRQVIKFYINDRKETSEFFFVINMNTHLSKTLFPYIIYLSETHQQDNIFP